MSKRRNSLVWVVCVGGGGSICAHIFWANSSEKNSRDRSMFGCEKQPGPFSTAVLTFCTPTNNVRNLRLCSILANICCCQSPFLTAYTSHCIPTFLLFLRWLMFSSLSFAFHYEVSSQAFLFLPIWFFLLLNYSQIPNLSQIRIFQIFFFPVLACLLFVLLSFDEQNFKYW